MDMYIYMYMYLQYGTLCFFCLVSMVSIFIRSGSIFELAFVNSLVDTSKDVKGLSDKTKHLLNLIHDEATCSGHSVSFVSSNTSQVEKASSEEPTRNSSGEKRRISADECETPNKKQKLEEGTPKFYYNLHSRQIKGINLPG